MKKEVEDYQGKKLTEAVITVPAAFNQTQINATIEAGKLAGLESIHTLPEPIAACLTYASKKQIPDNSTVLLFDLGGGTLDVCVIRIKDQNLNILGTFGDLYLGGRDFDAVLVNHFTAVLKHNYNLDLINDMNDGKLLKRYKLLLLCQGIKHDLQCAESAWLDVDDIDGNLDGQITIKKDEFEKFSEGLLLRIRYKIFGALNNINMDTTHISHILLAGGGCRMAMVKELLKNIFPNSQHLCTIDPDWAVAYGATLYSYYLKTVKHEDFKTKNQQESSQGTSKLEPQKTETQNETQNPQPSADITHPAQQDMFRGSDNIQSMTNRLLLETGNKYLKEMKKQQNSPQQQQPQPQHLYPPLNTLSLLNQLFQKGLGR
uniref:Heat shock protein 70 n=1 Tax=Panagrolaimus sp. ES5 TaxID=591445 RepID=A0AC34F907_9BILA